jgi:hypothetical protein
VSKRKLASVVPHPAPNPNALSFSLKEAAQVTGIALWAIRSAIWARKLSAHVIGKRQIVLRADLEKWIVNQPIANARRVAS